METYGEVGVGDDRYGNGELVSGWGTGGGVMVICVGYGAAVCMNSSGRGDEYPGLAPYQTDAARERV
ncbi:hypothetical protein Ancab_024954 [Ancistrocladus abbreviatus]